MFNLDDITNEHKKDLNINSQLFKIIQTEF